MSRSKFVNLIECSQRIRDVSEVEKIEQSISVEIGQIRINRQHRFDLRPKQKTAFADRIMKGLFAETVPCDQQALLTLVPDREGEHSAQAVHTIGSIFFVKVNDDLGVSIGVKAMAAGLEARSQFGKVVDLSIKNDPDRAIFIVDWLLAGRKIDDAQPTHAQAGAAMDIDPFVIRSTMHDRLAHAVDIRRIDCVVLLNTDNACYPTHSLQPSEKPF